MQPAIDEELQYMYYQLQVVKSDLQPHVHGWHKYRKMRDLSVKIFPSVHSLLLKRFSTDNAVLRLEQHNLCYSQSLRDAFQYKCAISEGKLTDCAPEIIRGILAEKENKDIVYSADNSPYRIELIETGNDYESFMDRVVSAVNEKDTTNEVYIRLHHSCDIIEVLQEGNRVIGELQVSDTDKKYLLPYLSAGVTSARLMRRVLLWVSKLKG